MREESTRPVPRERRDVLRWGGALGITSLTLPVALSHASTVTTATAVATAPTFGDSDVVLAAWVPGISDASAITPDAPGAATTTATGIAAEYVPGPSDSFVDTSSEGYAGVDAQGEIGANPGENRSISWLMRNTDETVDTTTAPYLEFRLTTGDAAVDLTALAINGLGMHVAFNLGGSISIRTSLGGYGISLRDAVVPAPNDPRNVLVNLSGIPRVAAATTLAFRILFYATQVQTGTGFPSGINFDDVSSSTALDAAVDTYDAVQGSHAISLIGTIVP